MRLGRFETVRMPELRPWRCHVRGMGIGRVCAREIVDGRIDRYLVRIDATAAECWVDAGTVRPASGDVLAFPARAARAPAQDAPRV